MIKRILDYRFKVSWLTDLSKRTADHGFVPGDPACGWDRQCSVIVPVIECGEIVGAHCGRPPEAHMLWASKRDEEAAAPRLLEACEAESIERGEK